MLITAASFAPSQYGSLHVCFSKVKLLIKDWVGVITEKSSCSTLIRTHCNNCNQRQLFITGKVGVTVVSLPAGKKGGMDVQFTSLSSSNSAEKRFKNYALVFTSSNR